MYKRQPQNAISFMLSCGKAGYPIMYIGRACAECFQKADYVGMLIIDNRLYFEFNEKSGLDLVRIRRAQPNSGGRMSVSAWWRNHAENRRFVPGKYYVRYDSNLKLYYIDLDKVHYQPAQPVIAEKPAAVQKAEPKPVVEPKPVAQSNQISRRSIAFKIIEAMKADPADRDRMLLQVVQDLIAG